MLNVLDHAQVPIANGSLRSGGKDLIAGELVEQFWTWPKHIQDMTLRERKVVMLSAADAQVAMARAAEVRKVNEVKEERAEVNGIQAEISGINALLTELATKMDELTIRRAELAKQLEPKLIEVVRAENDPSIRPEDDETRAVAAAQEPIPDVELATGLKNPEPPAELPQGEPVLPAAPVAEKVILLPPEAMAEIREWAAKLTYKELQAEAVKLQIPSVGVRRAVLEGKVVIGVAEELAREKAGPQA